MLKKLLKDCLPTIFSLMMVSLYGVIDGLFIGNMVGDVGLAGINIAWPIPAFIIATGIGIGIGGSVLIGYKRGQGLEEESYEIFQITFTVLLLAAVVLTGILWVTYPQLLHLFGATGEVYQQATYYIQIAIIGATAQIFSAGIVPILRNYSYPLEAMYCMVTGTISNIIINYILICVLELGMRGAAIGTVLSQALVAIMSLVILCRRIGKYPKLILRKDVVKNIFRVGITGFGISIAPSITLLFTNLQCLKYGGDGAVACYAVIAYIVFPVQSLITGIGEGTQPLISFYNGAKQEELLKQATRIAYGMVAVLSLFLTLVIRITAPYLGMVFGLSEEGRVYFDIGILYYVYAFILAGFVKFISCYLNATMETKRATLLTYMESLLVAPILLLVLPMVMGIEGVWLSYPLTAISILALNQCLKKL